MKNYKTDIEKLTHDFCNGKPSTYKGKNYRVKEMTMNDGTVYYSLQLDQSDCLFQGHPLGWQEIFSSHEFHWNTTYDVMEILAKGIISVRKEEEEEERGH